MDREGVDGMGDHAGHTSDKYVPTYTVIFITTYLNITMMLTEYVLVFYLTNCNPHPILSFILVVFVDIVAVVVAKENSIEMVGLIMIRT